MLGSCNSITAARRRDGCHGRRAGPNAESEAFESDKAIAAYQDDAFGTGDAGGVGRTLGAVTRAKGMAAVAEQADLSREQLEKSLRPVGDRAENDGRFTAGRRPGSNAHRRPRRQTISP